MFIATFILSLQLWHFITQLTRTILMFVSVAELSKPTEGSLETFKLQKRLASFFLRLGSIPISAKRLLVVWMALLLCRG